MVKARRRILIITIGGILGGIPVGIMARTEFHVVALVILAGLISLGFGIGSELTEKRTELIRIITRTLSCIFTFFISFWVFSFFTNVSNFFDELCFLVATLGLIFIPMALGISIADGLLKKRNIIVRIVGTTIGGALFCGVARDILAFPHEGHSNQGFLFGGFIAFGISLGLAISQLIAKNKGIILKGGKDYV